MACRRYGWQPERLPYSSSIFEIKPSRKILRFNQAAGLWSCRRRFGGRFVKATMTPAPMSLFDLLEFLALFVCEIGSHLPVRLSAGFMHAPARRSPNVPDLHPCLIAKPPNLGDFV